MSSILIPIIGAVCITITLGMYFFFSAKNKACLHKTLQEALNKGAELTPDLIEKMSNVRSPKVADLRKGVIFVSLGLAIISAGIIDEEAQRAMSVGILPIMLGLGFLTIWKLDKY